MAQFIGMDTNEVNRLAANLKGQADAIEGVIKAVNNAVSQLQGVWKGQDAVQFADWWNSQHRPHLQQAANAVRGLGQSAQNNATEQAQVSGR